MSEHASCCLAFIKSYRTLKALALFPDSHLIGDRRWSNGNGDPKLTHDLCAQSRGMIVAVVLACRTLRDVSPLRGAARMDVEMVHVLPTHISGDVCIFVSNCLILSV